MCCLQDSPFRQKNTKRLKVGRQKKIFCAKSNTNRAGVAILPSEKTDFKSKKITRDKEI